MVRSVFVKVKKTKVRPPQDGLSKEQMLKLMYSLWPTYKEKAELFGEPDIFAIPKVKFDIRTSNY